ncbi:hypothetical protein AAHC03_01260 [Spirometra sp. Aus1]
MSDTVVEYFDCLLKNLFGDAAVAVVRSMHIRGPVSLRDIDRSLSGKIGQRKTAACLMSLLRHRIVRFIPGDTNKYDINFEGIQMLSSAAGDILLPLFATGTAKTSEILRAALMRSAKGSKEDYKKSELLVDTLAILTKTGLLQPVKSVCHTEVCDEEQERPPSEYSISKTELLDNLQKFVSAGGKVEKFRQNLPTTKPPSPWDVVLTPNIDTLNALWRDKIIAQVAAERIDETAGDIMSRLLCVANTSNRCTHILSAACEAVSHAELMRSLKEVPTYLDSYIALLLDDPFCLLEQQPGIAGGMYICPYKKIVKHLLIRHAENVVQVLFENSGLRIFRILVAEGYLSCEALERRLLIPQKDFRRVLPRMVASGFISTTEFSSSKDFTADSIVCLYHVNLPVLARMLIEHSQHALLRLNLRSQAELKEKNRLVEQRYRTENLIRLHEAKITQLSTPQPALPSSAATAVATGNSEPESLLAHHEESVRALKSSMTPGELEQLSALTARLSKLSSARYEADTAWFVADLYVRMYY